MMHVDAPKHTAHRALWFEYMSPVPAVQACVSLFALVISFLLLLGAVMWWGHPAGVTITTLLSGILLALVFRTASVLGSLVIVANDACASGARVGLGPPPACGAIKVPAAAGAAAASEYTLFNQSCNLLQLMNSCNAPCCCFRRSF